MNADQAAALREAFPPEAIGKLPKLTCKDCSNARFRVCEKHEKQRCQACGNWISTAHVDLDYVGHAAATDRLLKVDPEWTWEPVTGPELDALRLADSRGLWIRLTIAGVSRLGFGDGPDGKQMIGDALRNAAMRFGVALDLWAKEDLSEGRERHDGENAPAAPEQPWNAAVAKQHLVAKLGKDEAKKAWTLLELDQVGEWSESLADGFIDQWRAEGSGGGADDPSQVAAPSPETEGAKA